jgi:hypothetical protein
MISGIVTPPIYNYNDPDPVFVYGEPIATFGFENHGVVNGFGLLTRGLLWQYFDLWFDADYYSNLATTWSDADATITTTWTSPQYGMFGEYNP